MTHRKLLAASALFVVPLTAFALDFTRAHLPYEDVDPSTPESAAISMLTGEGVLQGYDDGTFRPEQHLNRAEFLKIAVESTYANFMTGYAPPEKACFPDVPLDIWYSPYACFGKGKDVVSGYPDPKLAHDRWPFHGEREVNYAEAVKMLSVLYEYDLSFEAGEQWYSPYLRAANEHGTALEADLPMDTLLTRGQMARLAAAYLAESHGQLEEYRMAERGEYAASSSSSRSSSASSMSSSASSQASSVASSSSSSAMSSSSSSLGYTIPAVGHFLVVGRASDAIADGVIRPAENANIRAAEVSLFQEVPAVDYLELTDAQGKTIARLNQRTNVNTADYKQYYEAQWGAESGYAVAGNADTRLAVRAVIRTPDNNGSSERLLQVRTFKLTLVGDPSNTSFSMNIAGPFPKHQTALGRIASVMSTGPSSATMAAATGALLGTFTFTGDTYPGSSLLVTDLLFTLQRTGTVGVSNIRIGQPGGATTDCTMGSDGITCSNIPAATGMIPAGGSLSLQLKADIAPTGTATLEADLQQAGSPEALGSVWWTDQSGKFKWVEGALAPLARGTRFQ